MNERNKLSLSLYAKIIALGVWLFVTIIACAGNWNWNPEGFVEWCAAILLVLNVVAILLIGSRCVKEYNAEIKAIQDREKEEREKAANRK